MDASMRADPPTRRGAARIASLVIATTTQSGVTLVQQGVVVVGVFFIIAYHLTLAQMGAVVSLVSVGWMISALLTGMLMDAFGPRIVQFCGSLLMSASALLISYSHSLPLICVLLVVLGLGVSVTSLAGTVMVISLWPREERGLPFGVRQMGVPLGAMAAALILPSLAAAYGLSTLFRIFAVTLLVVGIGFSLTLPRHTRDLGERPRANVGDALLHTLREMRQIVFPSLTGFLLAFGQYTLLSITIPMLHADGALSVAAAGVILAVAQLGGAIARIGLGAITDRSAGRLDLTLGACAAVGAAMALVVAFTPLRLPFAALVVIWLLLGMTMVGWNALIVMWSSERVQEQNSGAAIGLTTSCILLGGIIAPPFMGGVIQTTHAYGSAWVALAVILLLASGVIWWGFRRQRAIPIVAPLASVEAGEAI
ncbi:MAG TPA: MFS transporter [Ktedonobacterales bacterium]|nr:MFS transporter [Ktedonobacterales bacterium]